MSTTPYVYYRAIRAFQYTTPRPDVLTLQLDDIVCVPAAAKENNGWLQGILLRTKKTGLFPASYVKKVEQVKQPADSSADAKTKDDENEYDDEYYYYDDEEENTEKEVKQQTQQSQQNIKNNGVVASSITTSNKLQINTKNKAPNNANDEEGDEYYYYDEDEENNNNDDDESSGNDGPQQQPVKMNTVTIEKMKRNVDNLTPLVTVAQTPNFKDSASALLTGKIGNATTPTITSNIVTPGRGSKNEDGSEYYEYYDDEESIAKDNIKNSTTIGSAVSIDKAGLITADIESSPRPAATTSQQQAILTTTSGKNTDISASALLSPSTMKAHDEALKARQTAFDEMAANLRQESEKRAEFELEVMKLRQKLEFYEESLNVKDKEIKGLQTKLEAIYKKNESLTESLKQANEKAMKLEAANKRTQEELQTIMGFEADKSINSGAVTDNTDGIQQIDEANSSTNNNNTDVYNNTASLALSEIKLTKHRIEELERENLEQMNQNDDLNSKLIELTAQLEYNKGEAEKYRKLEEVLLLNDIEPMEILETIDKLEQESKAVNKDITLESMATSDIADDGNEIAKSDEKEKLQNSGDDEINIINNMTVEDMINSKMELMESEEMQKKKEAISQSDAEKLVKYTENNNTITNLAKIRALQQELCQKELAQHKLERLVNTAGVNSTAAEEKQKWEEAAKFMEKDLIRMKLEIQVVRAAENGIDIAPLVKNVTKRRRRRKNIISDAKEK